jgi:hypothetical protein
VGSLRNPLTLALVVLVCSFGSLQVRAQGVNQKPEGKAKSLAIVDLSTDELRRQHRAELGRLEFADDPQELRVLVRKTGENVDAFFRNVQNTASKEEILAQRLKLTGKVEASSHSSCSYLLLARPDRIGMLFEEDRADRKNRPIKFGKLEEYVVTSGFASQCMFLHPDHQYSSRFRYLGKLPSAHVIAFAQKPDARDFLNFINGTEPTPVLLQGLVWIDPVTYQIVRMRTDLLEPDTRNGVARQTTESWLSEVRFDGVPQAFWLPRQVVVTIEYRQKIFRNEHRYSGYKLFSVSSFDKIVKP